jgi:hypothetical protein
MTYPLEYHNVVNRPARRPLQASPALCGSLLLLLLPSSSAQINASNSAHYASVAPPTASIAPRTGPVAPPTGGLVYTHSPHSSGTSLNNNGNHHPTHTANGTAYYPYIYALPVPYAVDISATETPENDEDADDQGGPAIFDPRGPSPDSYAPPSDASPQDALLAQSAADPEPPQPLTTLVFKDGHQIEVNNYAIVSQTLYDLTPGHPRKIALADLDLAATQKQNDDRGVTFQLPPQAQAN